jgi:TPR repeat protein
MLSAAFIGLLVASISACAAAPAPEAASTSTAVAPPPPPQARAADSPPASSRCGGDCMKLGDADFLRRDFVSSEHFYVSACDGGNGFGCANAGFIHEQGLGSVPVDYVEARRFATRACELGEGLGCNNLGALFRHGRGVTLDLSRAAALYRQACDAGSPIGCRNLGSLTATGEGTARDPKRAVELLDGACNGGDGVACFRLGEILEHGVTGALGFVLPVDKDRSADAFRRGCDGTNTIRADCHSCKSFSPEACFRLARLQRTQTTNAPDPKATEKLMMRACQNGVAAACEELHASPSP